MIAIFALLVALLLTSTPAIRINCGGPTIIPDILQDSPDFFSTSSSKVFKFLSDVKPTTVYHSHTFCTDGQDLVYKIPATDAGKPGERARVIARFSEQYAGAASKGGRVIRLLVNNQLVADNLDVWLEAGGSNMPFDIIEEATIQPDGTVEIRIQSLVQNAMISGIDVVSILETLTDENENVARIEEMKRGKENLPMRTEPASIRVNCGGPAIAPEILQDSPQFFGASPGIVNKFTSNVKPVTVYRSHAYASDGNDLVYQIPATNVWKPGEHVIVVARFSEQYAGAAGEGARVMRIFFNDVLIRDNLDVWHEAGGLNLPLDVSKEATVKSDGIIEVRVKAVTQNAMISGIDVMTAPNIRREETQNLTKIEDMMTEGNEKLPSNESKKNNTDVLPSLEGKPQNLNGPQLIGSGAWRTVQLNGNTLPAKRHEACAVMNNGLLYLIGGRGFKPVSVFDPKRKTWVNKKFSPVELNHMQCVSVGTSIFVVGAWHGRFPFETAHNETWIYNTTNDSWSTEPGLPASRRRGGGTLVVHDNKLWLAMGNRGGHGQHAESVGMLDVYDLADKASGWRELPTAPDPRDHVAGGVIGDYYCIAGGRNGGVANFWSAPVTRINCYNFKTNKWERRANLPFGRAGAATGVTCQGLLMVAGGEGRPGGIFDRADLYDVEKDEFLQPVTLKKGRHGSGLGITDCSCGNIYIPSGSGGLGGGPELFDTEVWSPDGKERNC